MANKTQVTISTPSVVVSGILHQGDTDLLVIFVNGGAQTRIGPHRLYVTISERLQREGISSFRFDLPGFGDADGSMLSFLDVPVLLKSISEHFLANHPSLKQVVFFGLCDGATSILLLNPSSINACKAIALVNPWVRQECSHAMTMAKHYYLKRFFNKELWRKFGAGQLNISQSFVDLSKIVKSVIKPRSNPNDLAVTELNYVERAWTAWHQYKGRTLLFLSGKDITAAEFFDAASNHPIAKGALASAQVFKRDVADHTFSSVEDKNWLLQIFVEQMKNIAMKKDQP